jgi:hypothetical protein
MGVLITVSKIQDSPTIFETARKMAQGGEKIVFLFTSEACNLAADPDIIDSIDFAEGVHCLVSDFNRIGDEKPARGVRFTDYSGWVELVEANEKIVSWA